MKKGKKILSRQQTARDFLAILLCLAMLLSAVSFEKASVNAATSFSYTSSNQEVIITLTESKVNDYWYEYYLSVQNKSVQSICDWSITLQVSDISKYSQAFECSGTVKDGVLVVKGTGNNKVVAGGTTLSNRDSFKLGFGNSVSFSQGEISYSYGTESSEGDAADGVGYGNTYLSGYQCDYDLTGEVKELDASETPVGKHGALHVDGTHLKDKNNENIILRGASTHGMHWGEMTPFVNKDAFQSLRDEWGVNLVRLVSYVTQRGYTEGNQVLLDNCIQNGVSYATDLGMYALIDWHIHNENPNDTKDAAITFFNKYSKMYADNKNVLYEICNEPTNTPWPQIKSYAEDVVRTIRANDPDAIIIVGTNTWSQDVDEVAVNGGKIADSNVMYTFHFYSGTHGESYRNKVRKALSAGTPVFCTEFGVCDSSGNGGFDLNEADAWIDFFEEEGISYSCWSLCNKDESASMISPQSSKTSRWTNEDLGATGAWLINTYRSKAGEAVTPTGSPTASPTGSPTASPTGSPTASPTSSPTASPDGSQSPTPSDTSFVTESPDVSESPTPSGSPVVTTTPAPTQTTVVAGGDNGQGEVGSQYVPTDFSQKHYQIYITAKKRLDVNFGEGQSVLSYKSSRSKVASVNSKGIVRGKKAGKVVITATLSDGSQVTCSVKVKKPKVYFRAKKLLLKQGKKSKCLQIKKKIPSDKVVAYRVNGKAVAVSKKGVVKGLKRGTAKVTVVMKSGAKAKCNIVVR